MRSSQFSNFAKLFRLKVWRHISVEPTMFFGILSIKLMDFLNTNLYLQKVCRFNITSEPDLSTKCDDEIRGLEFITTVYTNFITVSITVSIICSIFTTTYSDVIGRKRKPFLVASLIGMLLQQFSAMLQAYFWQWPPLLGVILNCFSVDICGGMSTLFNFSNLSVLDESRHEDRLTRLTILGCVVSASTVIAKLTAGYLLRAVGFLYSFFTCFILTSLALLCTLVLVKDKCSIDLSERKVSLMQIFNLRQVFESLKCILFSSKSIQHKIAVWFLLIVTIFVQFVAYGDDTVFYLYLRHTFHWDERQFSVFSTYGFVIRITGGLFCSFIMSKLLKIHDAILGTLASFCDTLASIGFFFAVQKWQLFAVPFLDAFHGIALSTSSAYISKFFLDDEYGKLFSVRALFNMVIPLCHLVYSTVFRITMNTLPNAFFLLSAFLNMVTCVMYGLIYFLSKDIK